MNRRRACIALAAGAGALAALARESGTSPDRGAQASLLISGAAAMLPLTTALAEAFLRGRDGLSILVERGGSLPAYIAASRGAIDVAAMTRALSDGEDDAGARHYLIARDHIRIVANRTLPLANLSRAEVRAVFAGEIANWRALGGPDRPVAVYAHPRGAVARQSAEQLLLDGGDFSIDARECAGDAALTAAVTADPAALSCLAGHVRAGADRLAVLAVDGVRATRATLLSGRYPYTYSFHLLLHGEPDAARTAFLRFARSAAGQAIVERLGLVAVC